MQASVLNGKKFLFYLIFGILFLVFGFGISKQNVPVANACYMECWSGGLGCTYDDTTLGFSSDWACVVNTSKNGGASSGNCTDTITHTACQLNSCPTGFYDIGANGKTCEIRYATGMLSCSETVQATGKWDATQSKCIACTADNKESDIYDIIAGPSLSVTGGDMTFRSSCGADTQCNGFTTGAVGFCTGGQTCDSSGHCAGGPTPTPTPAPTPTPVPSLTINSCGAGCGAFCSSAQSGGTVVSGCTLSDGTINVICGSTPSCVMTLSDSSTCNCAAIPTPTPVPSPTPTPTGSGGNCSSTMCGAANSTPCNCGGTTLTGANVWCGYTPTCSPGQGFSSQAACQTACLGGSPPPTPTGSGSPTPMPSGCGGPGMFVNPLIYCSFPELIAAATNWVLGLVSSIIILILIIGGIMYVTSTGDEERIRTAKNIILYAIIGLAIVLLAYSLISEVKLILKIT